MITFFSPSKVNLFFRVLYRRSDGFHEIASLYQALSLGDRLSISLAKEDLLTCDDPTLPCDQHNLVMKALAKFREKTGENFKVHFHLEKKVPIQSGLGGGSGNAATALWALNTLSSHPVESNALANWAAEFSSDAPFFFSSGTAYCTGRGEVIAHLPSLPHFDLCIAKPEGGLSTPLVYKQCQPELFMDRNPQLFLARALKGDLETFNDLEQPACALMPSLAVIKNDLLQLGFDQVTMTGSGTAFMCIGKVEESIAKLPDPNLSHIAFFPASFIQRSSTNWYTTPA